MYCPKCSQQQASEDLRFCSRCGFPLTGVALLVENDGAIPSLQQVQRISGRRGRIMKESGVLTLASWVVAVLSTNMWDWGGPFESIAKVAAVIFFVLGLIGLLRFVYAFLFVSEDVATAQEPALPKAASRAALAAPRENPLTDYPLRSNTKEMVPRGSVTEHTTRLLDDE